jgi:hypothetical protein
MRIERLEALPITNPSPARAFQFVVGRAQRRATVDPCSIRLEENATAFS